MNTTTGYMKYVGKFGPILTDDIFADLPVSLWGWLEEGSPAEWPLLVDGRVAAYLEDCVAAGKPMDPETFTRRFWADGTGVFRFPVVGGNDVVADDFDEFIKMVGQKEVIGY